MSRAFEIKRRINNTSLAANRPNWDDEGGVCLEGDVVFRATFLAVAIEEMAKSPPLPKVVPCGDGSIHLYYRTEKSSVEVEVFRNIVTVDVDGKLFSTEGSRWNPWPQLVPPDRIDYLQLLQLAGDTADAIDRMDYTKKDVVPSRGAINPFSPICGNYMGELKSENGRPTYVAVRCRLEENHPLACESFLPIEPGTGKLLVWSGHDSLRHVSRDAPVADQFMLRGDDRG